MRISYIYTLLLFVFLSSCDDCKNDTCEPEATFRYVIQTAADENIYEDEDENFEPETTQIICYKNGIASNNCGEITAKNILVLVVDETIDSTIVKYNESDEAKFVTSNFIYTEDECCGTYLTNFDMDINDQNFCTNCNDDEWVIEE